MMEDSTQVSMKEQELPGRLTGLQKARARLLKGVSYFAGDMEPFGKWMESKLFDYLFKPRKKHIEE